MIERLVARLGPLWTSFDDAARELDEEAGHVVEHPYRGESVRLEALERLHRALARQSMFDRLIARVGRSSV